MLSNIGALVCQTLFTMRVLRGFVEQRVEVETMGGCSKALVFALWGVEGGQMFLAVLLSPRLFLARLILLPRF